jgi:Family of unknown function (DUF6131)
MSIGNYPLAAGPNSIPAHQRRRKGCSYREIAIAPFAWDLAPLGTEPLFSREERSMIVLGLVLLILGWLLGVGILWTIGIILIVVGAILWILGSMDRGIGGRRHYW